jgi:hypothetical protein
MSYLSLVLCLAIVVREVLIALGALCAAQDGEPPLMCLYFVIVSVFVAVMALRWCLG